MIEMPKRSVTRFFIPLIDVLTLMFCIFLLMPVVKPSREDAPAVTAPRAEAASDRQREHQELERLRGEREQWQDLKKLAEEKAALRAQLNELHSEKIETLQNRLHICVLEIGDEGRLFAYDPARERDRRIEITRENAEQFIAAQRKKAGAEDLYFLLTYPRPATGFPAFPLRSQREEYDRWFQGVAHGYDIR